MEKFSKKMNIKCEITHHKQVILDIYLTVLQNCRYKARLSDIKAGLEQCSIYIKTELFFHK